MQYPEDLGNPSPPLFITDIFGSDDVMAVEHERFNAAYKGIGEALGRLCVSAPDYSTLHSVPRAEGIRRVFIRPSLRFPWMPHITYNQQTSVVGTQKLERLDIIDYIVDVPDLALTRVATERWRVANNTWPADDPHSGYAMGVWTDSFGNQELWLHPGHKFNMEPPIPRGLDDNPAEKIQRGLRRATGRRPKRHVTPLLRLMEQADAAMELYGILAELGPVTHDDDIKLPRRPE